METIVNIISVQDYNDFNCKVLFEDKKTDRSYGVISNGNVHFKFGWQSDTIKPFKLDITSETCFLGVDLNTVIINFESKNIVFKALLEYFFYSAKIFKEYILIITELEILVVSLLNYQVLNSYALPDFFEEIEFNGDKITIKCSGSQFVTFNL